MKPWLVYAIISLVLYGFWGFFPKLSVREIDPLSALLYEIVGALFVGLLVLLGTGPKVQFTPPGFWFAFFTGVSGMVGTLFFFKAAKDGPISVVVSLTALYPLITIILAAFLLKEPLTLRQLLGMGLALMAIFLMSS